MNCKEMIDLFQQCGGIMYCGYTNKQCKVLNTNLKCNIETEEDKHALDRLVWSNMHNNRVTFGKGTLLTVMHQPLIEIDQIHRFQEPGATYMEVNLLNDDKH